MGDRPRILVADDIPRNVRVLRDRLESEGLEVMEASDGVQALERIREHRPDLVLLDIVMPLKTGYQVLEEVRADQELRRIPIVVVSALGEIDSVARCIQLGAQDYLLKPFNATLLMARVRNCLERKRLDDLERNYRVRLEEQVREQVREISLSQLGVIFAMSKLVESRDAETGMHIERMQEYCRILARHLRFRPGRSPSVDGNFVENVYAASPLHDIGKVGVPDQILRKPQGLTAEEFAVMKTHPALGGATLRAVGKVNPNNEFVRYGIQIAEGHHEKWDGSGYPAGIAGENIPLAGRVVALADVYDAMTSRRCYHVELSHEETRDFIVAQNGKSFDPSVVEGFLDTEAEFRAVRKQFCAVPAREATPPPSA